jgi:hypothetical protein
LHYALDAWLRREMRSVRFCRYAGDGAIHCKSEAQARLVLRKLGERLRVCGLVLHPEKTRIVYCHDVNRQAAYPTIQFTFLGYTFRPRKAVDKYGRVYLNFSLGVSREALRTMRQTVMAPAAQERLRAERSLEHVWPGHSGLDQLLRSIPPVGVEIIVEARERLLGALDAAEVQAPGSRCHAGCTGTGPSRGERTTVIRALGDGILPGGSVTGAG